MDTLDLLLKKGWKIRTKSFGGGDNPLIVITKGNEMAVYNQFSNSYTVPPLKVNEVEPGECLSCHSDKTDSSYRNIPVPDSEIA